MKFCIKSTLILVGVWKWTAKEGGWGYLVVSGLVGWWLIGVLGCLISQKKEMEMAKLLFFNFCLLLSLIFMDFLVWLLLNCVLSLNQLNILPNFIINSIDQHLDRMWVMLKYDKSFCTKVLFLISIPKMSDFIIKNYTAVLNSTLIINVYVDIFISWLNIYLCVDGIAFVFMLLIYAFWDWL